MGTVNKACPFCFPERKSPPILETKTVYSIYDKYPVNPGHSLIIPVRHCPGYFELTKEEQDACWSMLNEVKRIIEKRYNPDGFNVGINIGQAGGQTISHVHIHLIPRYTGDHNEPEGGVRGVIPGKQKY